MKAARNGQHLPIDAQPSGRQECDNFVGSKHDMKSKLVALILLAASTASAKEK